MSKNGNLNNAIKNKEDEFYTQLSDIEEELRHYRKQFKNKVVFCNCDDPYESNFFKYFAMNFNQLELKKLIAISYVGSPVAQTQLRLFFDNENPEEQKKAFKIEITEVKDFNKDGAINLLDVEYLLQNDKNAKTLLNGNGDFRSPESLEMLKECDIVVTNPPFSLFREYLALLVESGKQFLILGNQNNVSYKDTFPLLMGNKVWLGYKAGDMAFTVPDYYEERNTRFWIDENGTHWRSFGNICWYTNMDTTKRHEILTLYKKYTPEEYPNFDNFPEAINVNKVSDIPCDYAGIMGVPLTFLTCYNPDQFEIVGDEYILKIPKGRGYVNGEKKYSRIFIKNKNPERS